MSTGLENDLLGDAFAIDDTPEEQEEEQSAQCTNEYFSNAYGQQYCVGDTIETADGPMVVTSIWEGQAVTDVYGGDLDADELYDEMGTEMGLSEEEFASFIDSYNELKREAAALDTSHHVLGPTEMERGRLGIRIRQANPDWTEEQINAEVDRLLDPKTRTAEQYADLARREAELFEQYGMQSQNHATFGQGVFVNSEGKYFKFTGSNGYWQQTSQDDGFLDYAVPIGIALGTAVISGGLAGSLNGIVSSVLPSLSTTASTALSKTLASIITQAVSTGGQDVDFASALMQGLEEFASIEGIGDLLGDLGIEGSTPEWLTDILDKGEEFLGQVEELVSTGIEPIDAMIQAGGKDVLEQLVTTGEIDPQQALLSMAQTGMVEGVEWLFENYGDELFNTETRYGMRDAEGNEHWFEDKETALAFVRNNGGLDALAAEGIEMLEAVPETNELFEWFMEGGGGAALEGASAILDAAQNAGYLPTVNPDVGSQRYEYIGEGKFRDVTTGEVWTVENTDGLIPGMTVSDDWMAANDAQNTDEVWMDDGIDNDYTDVIDDIVDEVDDTRDEVVDDTTEVVDDVTDEVVEEVVEPIEEVEEIIEVHEDFVNPQDKVTDLLNNMAGQVNGSTDSEVDNETDADADGTENDGDATEGGDNGGTQGNGQSGNGEDGDGDDGTGQGPGGDGIGIGAGSGGGLLSGGSFDPKVTDLFKYTRLTPYQKQALEPLKQQISTVKGMLS